MSFAVLLFVLCAMPVVKAEAKEGVLKEYFPSSTVYCLHSQDMYASIGFPRERGDKVTYTNLTPKNLWIMNFGVEYGNNNYINIKKVKSATGKIRIKLVRGGKTYTKVLSVKWYNYPVPKKLTVGGKNYLSKIRNNTYYNNVSGYLTGKLSVTPPSGWKLDSTMFVLYETKDGVKFKNLSVKSTLPKKCVHMGFTLINKKNPKITQAIQLSVPPTNLQECTME